jgi:pseudaminic acid synthase
MEKIFNIEGREIGLGKSPYIIAELSANHNGSIEKAEDLIRFAKIAGADAIKIQTYRPDTITFKSDKPDFMINDGLWSGHSLYSLYEWAHTPWEWHPKLFDFAKKNGITIFSSPFDKTAVDLLEDLNVPAYKIASFEIVDLALIKYAASTRKPLIISTGMASIEDIQDAIDAAKSAGCQDLAILHCVSAYPADPMDYNLKKIPDMIKKFDIPVGLSDHTLGNIAALGAVSLGASIVEKHFTISRDGGGADDSFSIEPEELRALCRDIKILYKSLGDVNYELIQSEKGSLKFRRSLYYAKDMKKGDLIKEDSIKSVRPGYGLSPKLLEVILGKKINADVEKYTAVHMSHINQADK